MDLTHELCPVQLLEVTKKSDILSVWLASIQRLAHISTAISHHSNKSMAILGVHLVRGEPLLNLILHWFPRARNFFPDDGVHQVLGWVKSPSRPFSCRQIPHLMKAAGLFSTLLLILGVMSYIVASRPSCGNFSPRCCPLKPWWCSSSYDPPIPLVIGVGYPSIFWMSCSSSFSNLSAVKPPAHYIFSPHTLNP